MTKRIGGTRRHFTRRKYPQVDEGMYISYVNSNQLVPAAHVEATGLPSEERRESIRAFNHFNHREAAGYADPISHAYVLDALQRANPLNTIRAKYLREELNKTQMAQYFDTTTTGKILAEIYDLGMEAYGSIENAAPIIHRVDQFGHLYAINSTPRTYKWFWKLRQQMVEKVQALMANEQKGIRPDRGGDAWDGIDTGPLEEDK